MENVPIIEADTSNFKELWPDIIKAVKSSTFIAIDNELSGLGSRRHINAKSVEERYKAICDVARTRSIISTGISCYQLIASEDTDSLQSCDDSKQDYACSRNLDFTVQTFSLFVLCKEHYVVEPSSLGFLVEHGFDFNRQYASGLPYSRDHTKQMVGDLNTPSLQNLFGHIILSKKPLVLHNGIVDLIFLYESFHATTPSSLGNFLADLAEMHPGGIYDTKYIAEFKARLPASYLQYIFRKCQKDNREATEKGWSRIGVVFPGEHDRYSINLPCGLHTQEESSQEEVCVQYANHGWCPDGQHCAKSHNIDHILSNEGQLQLRKRKRRRKKASKEEEMDTESESTSNIKTGAMEEVSSEGKTGCSSGDGASLSISSATDVGSSRVEGHRAGFDAFMTGYSFAFFVSRYGKAPIDTMSSSASCLGGEEFADKIYLGGKDIPLQVVKSAFAKNSKEHRDRMVSLAQGQPS